MKTKKCLLIWTELINIVLTTSTKFGNFWRNLMVKFYKSIFNLKSLDVSQYIYFNPTKIASIEDIKTIIELNNNFKLPNEANASDNYTNLSDYIYRNIKNIYTTGYRQYK